MRQLRARRSWGWLRPRPSSDFPTAFRCWASIPSATCSRRHYAPIVVAQTKRRRRTKHRGNAAGVVEARGRTGGKPPVAEKGGKADEAARAKEKSISRYDRPPSW